MLQITTALAAGLLFGAGLAVSRMVDPAKVLGFLDIAGNWDPSLAFVLAGAVATAGIGFRLVLGRRAAKPLFAEIYQLPTARDIDRRLIAGAVLFGVGWGLVGLCPGPALANLGLAFRPAAVFVAAMLVGMALSSWPIAPEPGPPNERTIPTGAPSSPTHAARARHNHDPHHSALGSRAHRRAGQRRDPPPLRASLPGSDAGRRLSRSSAGAPSRTDHEGTKRGRPAYASATPSPAAERCCSSSASWPGRADALAGPLL